MCASVHPHMCVCVLKRETDSERHRLTHPELKPGRVLCNLVTCSATGARFSGPKCTIFFYTIKTCISFETRQNQKQHTLLWANSLAVIRVSSQQALVLLVSNMITKFMFADGRVPGVNSPAQEFVQDKFKKKKKPRLKKNLTVQLIFLQHPASLEPPFPKNHLSPLSFRCLWLLFLERGRKGGGREKESAHARVPERAPPSLLFGYLQWWEKLGAI